MSWESLGFEDRQKAWTGQLRQFRQHHGRNDRPSVWEVRVEGSRVFTSHGLLNGAMQATDYVGKAKNAGRSNAITAEQDAIAEARRDIRKKWEFEGYDEYVTDQNIDHRHQDISIPALLTNLPGSFCVFKPENNLYDQKKLLEKANKGEVWYTLKRDGMAKWIVVDYYGNVQIYSRRSRPYHDKEGPKELPDGTLDYSQTVLWSARFPHLVEAVRQLNLPPGTMMAGELVCSRNGKLDDFKYIATLTKSYTQKALEEQASGHLAQFYWWDIPFFGGEDLVKEWPVHRRMHLIHELHAKAAAAQQHILPISILTFANPEAAEDHARKSGIEGWVVLDPLAVYGDKGWNLKGKPDRPSTCAKLKPRQEDDFIAFFDPDKGDEFGEWGTGKHEKGKMVRLPDGSEVVHGGVGSVALYQYNQSGELVYISKCSSGMDYAYQANLKKQSFPQVWQVEYVERTYISDGEKTNALRHPTFLRLREDKRVEECINPRL